MKLDDLNIIYGRDQEFREDNKKMPFIKFPSHWYVKLIGPFAGAATRFIVTLDPASGNSVSVYADPHERLGFFGGPHWEIYPDAAGENGRIALSDTSELIKEIELSLQKMEVE